MLSKKSTEVIRSSLTTLQALKDADHEYRKVRHSLKAKRLSQAT